jgi:hypothetical protein
MQWEQCAFKQGIRQDCEARLPTRFVNNSPEGSYGNGSSNSNDEGALKKIRLKVRFLPRSPSF